MNTPQIGETFKNGTVIKVSTMPARMGRYGGIVIRPELVGCTIVTIQFKEFSTAGYILTGNGWSKLS